MEKTKTLTIGFSYHSNNILSWLIKKIDNRPFSHIYFKTLKEDTGNVMVYQASGLQVNEASYSLFIAKAIVVKEINFEVDEEHYIESIRFLESILGFPYSLSQLFGIAFIRLAGKFNYRVIKNPLGKEQASYICSEVVAKVFRDIYKLNISADLDSISPRDMAQILVDNKLTEKFW